MCEWWEIQTEFERHTPASWQIREKPNRILTFMGASQTQCGGKSYSTLPSKSSTLALPFKTLKPHHIAPACRGWFDESPHSNPIPTYHCTELENVLLNSEIKSTVACVLWERQFWMETDMGVSVAGSKVSYKYKYKYYKVNWQPGSLQYLPRVAQMSAVKFSLVHSFT